MSGRFSSVFLRRRDLAGCYKFVLVLEKSFYGYTKRNSFEDEDEYDDEDDNGKTLHSSYLLLIQISTKLRQRRFDGDGKPETFIIAGQHFHGVDADDLPICINQRAAAVAGIYLGICFYKAIFMTGHDPGGHRIF